MTGKEWKHLLLLGSLSARTMFEYHMWTAAMLRRSKTCSVGVSPRLLGESQRGQTELSVSKALLAEISEGEVCWLGK